MKRVLEPELMDDEHQAIAYAEADFSDINQCFANMFGQLFPNFVGGRIVDLGCGPADIPIRLCRLIPGARITAVDASKPMIDLARKAIAKARLPGRIDLIHARVTDLDRGGDGFDGLISNSLLHHMPDPLVFWRLVSRLTRPGACVLVMDLLRPASRAEAEAAANEGPSQEPPILRRDYLRSLRAAFRPDEIVKQLGQVGLERLEVHRVDDRHWAACGSVSF